MNLEGINWIGVAIAVVANMFLAYLWFGPFWGKTWHKILEKAKEDIPRGPERTIWIGIFSLLSCIFITHIQNTTKLAFGGSQYWYIQAYLTLPTLVNTVFERRDIRLWVIKNSYYYLGLTVISMILLATRLES